MVGRWFMGQVSSLPASPFGEYRGKSRYGWFMWPIAKVCAIVKYIPLKKYIPLQKYIPNTKIPLQKYYIPLKKYIPLQKNVQETPSKGTLLLSSLFRAFGLCLMQKAFYYIGLDSKQQLKNVAHGKVVKSFKILQ